VKRTTSAYLFALAAVALWSTVASAFKLALMELRVLDLLFIAAVTSTVLLGVAAGMRGTLRDIASWGRREQWTALGLGVLNPALYYLVLFRAYDLLPAQQAQPLNYTWPITLALLSRLVLRERAGRVAGAALVLSFIGVLVISTRGDVFALRFSNPEGVALAVGSSLIWATYWIFNLRSARDETARLFLTFASGTMLIGVILAFDPPLQAPSLRGLAAGMYVGAFEMGLTFLLWMQALRRSGRTAAVGNLVYLSPFLSLFIIHLVVGESIHPSTVVGLLFIVSGILLQQAGGRLAGLVRVRTRSRNQSLTGGS
jgi:drug/metabolite transporter (DMT)-like permease